MIVIVISLISAAIQMALLLLTAKVIGVEQYTRFSLIVAISVFLSAAVSEWLRMIVARHAGSRRRRFRAAMLRRARGVTFFMSASLLVLGLSGGAVIDLFGPAAAAQFVAAIGVTASGMMLSDMSSVLLRYGIAQQWHYNAYTVGRVTLGGGASLIAALIGANGPVVAAAFGLSGIIIGGSYAALLWPRDGAIRPRLLRRLSFQGWSLATGSIGTNLALTLARLTLGIGLPSRIAGSSLLSIDLFSRGANVLGTALCNWGNRGLMDSAHRHGRAGAQSSFKRFSAVFLSVWFSIGLLGMAACLIIPLFTLHVRQVGLHIGLTLPTLCAIALLFMRIFLFDCLLSAVNKHREIALVATATAILSAIAALVAYMLHNEYAASTLFPGFVVALTLFYAVRNFQEFAVAVDRQALRFAGEKIVLLIVLAVAIAVHPAAILLIVLIGLNLALDARQALRLWTVFRPRRTQC